MSLDDDDDDDDDYDRGGGDVSQPASSRGKGPLLTPLAIISIASSHSLEPAPLSPSRLQAELLPHLILAQLRAQKGRKADD